jgi:3-methylcrotonyl-CoA carboxylase alpha subunit
VAVLAGAKAGDAASVQVWPRGSGGAGLGQGAQSYAFRVPAADVSSSSSSAAGRRTGAAAVKAPMPGKVVRLLVAAGDAVSEGQPLLILEAMKMEHVVVALRAGVVGAVHAAEGSVVSDGALLAELVADDRAATPEEAPKGSKEQHAQLQK